MDKELLNKTDANFEFRQQINFFEKEMVKAPNFQEIKLFVKYYSCCGIFTGELFIPKGCIFTGKIHKFDNLNVLTKGDISVSIDNKIERIVGPKVITAPAGVRRIFRAHEDSIWMTFHATKETDVREVEKYFIAQDEQDYLNFINFNQLSLNFEKETDLCG